MQMDYLQDKMDQENLNYLEDYQSIAPGWNVAFEVNYEFVERNGDCLNGKNDFYMEFTDKVVSTVPAIGKVDRIGDVNANRVQIDASYWWDETAEIMFHELGHTLGLRHETDDQNPLWIRVTMCDVNIMMALDLGNCGLSKNQLLSIHQDFPVENTSVLINGQKFDASDLPCDVQEKFQNLDGEIAKINK